MQILRKTYWGEGYISSAVIILLIFLIYFNVFRELAVNWVHQPDYSHGFLIPFISLHLVWIRRTEIAQISHSSSNCGLLIFILGLGQYLCGYIGAEHFLQSTSLIIVLLGMVIFLWGREIMSLVLFPIAYLIFMIPLPAIVWNKFAFSLKLFATETAFFFIQAIGVTALREGNIIVLPKTSLEVVDACSGLRSLISLLALSALIGFISKLSYWKKWILFALTVPIAILSNIIRLVITVILAQSYGKDVTEGIQHTFAGIFVFIIGIILIIITYKLLDTLPLKTVNQESK